MVRIFASQLRAPAMPLLLVIAASHIAFSQNEAKREASLGGSSSQAVLEKLQLQVEQMNSALRNLKEAAESLQLANTALRGELDEAKEQLATISSGSTKGSDSSGSSDSTAVPNQNQQNLEEHLGLIEQKVNEQYQTKVESASRYRVRLSGLVLLNMFTNTGNVNNIENPTLAANSLGVEFSEASSRNFGGTIRQTQIGFEVFGPSVFGARSSGNVSLDLAGNNDPLNGATVGILRLRSATGRIDWAKTTFVAGQDSLFFLPQSPTSLASLETPPLAYAGNLWAWLPQVRVERRFSLSNDSEISVQAGLLDPVSGESFDGENERKADAGEQSQRPAIATRVSWSRPLFGRTLSIGSAAYSGKQLYLPNTQIKSWLAAVDWQVPVSTWIALSGSIYRGCALGGLGGGLGRSVIRKQTDPSSLDGIVPQALNTIGGWAQMKLTLSPRYEINTAFGEDNPFASQLNGAEDTTSYLEASLARNWAAFTNIIYHPRSNLLLGLEYRRIRSQELNAKVESANHVNLSMGVQF